MGFSCVLGVSGLKPWSPLPWARSVIYTGHIKKSKAGESCSVWMLKFLILMAVELNILIWIEIGESPSPSGGPCIAKDKDELFPGSNCLVWMMIRLKDRDLPSIDFIFSSNYPTRLKFKLGEDSGLDVLKAATRRTSLGGSIDTCTVLGGSKSNHYTQHR